MSGVVYEVIRDAIANKKIVTATYRGKLRIMCPHVLGTKRGRYQALFYQFDGESTTGLKPDGDAENWRCMFLDELSDVSSDDASGQWHTAPNHSRPQTCVDQIDAVVIF